VYFSPLLDTEIGGSSAQLLTPNAHKYVQMVIRYPDMARSSWFYVAVEAGVFTWLPVAPSGAYSICETPPLGLVECQSFYFIPCFACFSSFLLHCLPPSFPGMPTSTSTLSFPIPLFFLYLNINCLLICDCPEIFIWENFGSSYVYDLV
jgi:hypothetical protein